MNEPKWEKRGLESQIRANSRFRDFCLRRKVFSASVPESDMSEPVSTPPQLSAAHWYSAPALWRTLKKVAAKASRQTLLSALTLFYCLKDRDTPTWARGIIVGALGYLILPADLIPDILPGAGYSDDWGAIVVALGTVAAYIKDEHKTKALAQVGRFFRSPNPPPPGEFFE